MALKKSQQSLKNWTKQKWRTKSGKPSTQGRKATGERYLPSSAIKSLSAAEYAATSRKKRRDTKKGKQFSKQPKKIARKTRSHRQNGQMTVVGGEDSVVSQRSLSYQGVLMESAFDIIVSAWPIAFGFVTLVIVLAKMHGDIIVLKEKVKSLFDLWNSRKDN